LDNLSAFYNAEDERITGEFPFQLALPRYFLRWAVDSQFSRDFFESSCLKENLSALRSRHTLLDMFFNYDYYFYKYVDPVFHDFWRLCNVAFCVDQCRPGLLVLKNFTDEEFKALADVYSAEESFLKGFFYGFCYHTAVRFEFFRNMHCPECSFARNNVIVRRYWLQPSLEIREAFYQEVIGEGYKKLVSVLAKPKQFWEAERFEQIFRYFFQDFSYDFYFLAPVNWKYRGPYTYDSYMVATEDLKVGEPRLLKTDRPLIIPARTHIRFLVTSNDVLHSFAIPAAGIKVDAVPGRLNQVSAYFVQEGRFFGQCSELCGVNHGFMPIEALVVGPARYRDWLFEKTYDVFFDPELLARSHLLEVAPGAYFFADEPYCWLEQWFMDEFMAVRRLLSRSLWMLTYAREKDVMFSGKYPKIPRLPAAHKYIAAETFEFLYESFYGHPPVPEPASEGKVVIDPASVAPFTEEEIALITAINEELSRGNKDIDIEELFEKKR
jgi:heme/copper-type cytochrome/quinol oxidase subunit 2